MAERVVERRFRPEPSKRLADQASTCSRDTPLDAKAQADRDLERAKAVLTDTANDPSATHASMDQWTAEVRRLTQVQSQTVAASKGITHEGIATRQNDLDGRIDAHRERIAGAVISDLERAAPLAVMQTVMAGAAERARDTGSE